MLRQYQPLLCLLILFSISAVANPSTKDNTLGFQPVVMLTEFNPWAMVVGSDSPTFVLYENGTVIYLKERKYFSAKLTRAEADAFVTTLGPEGLTKLKDSYTISEWTDQPTNVLLVRTDDKNYKKISVYGNIRPLVAKTEESLPLPTELSSAFRQVLKYENANSSPWVSEYIEVIIWPFEYAKGKAADWPTEWPGIADPKTVKRKETYSLFLPESQSKVLANFIAHLKPTQAVKIDNKKWAISTRFPFPHELR